MSLWWEYVYLLAPSRLANRDFKGPDFLWCWVDNNPERQWVYGKKEDATRRDCRAAPIVRLIKGPKKDIYERYLERGTTLCSIRLPPFVRGLAFSWIGAIALAPDERDGCGVSRWNYG